MEYAVTPESLKSLADLWAKPQNQLHWNSVFVLPAWMETWWREFGQDKELYLHSVRQNGELLGVAPLVRDGSVVSFLGSLDVCDYLDFIIVPGREVDFFNTLLDYLKAEGITLLNLARLRPDSTVLTELVPVALERACKVDCQQIGVSLELDLPATWDDYLDMLEKKQRHEVRRKIRRLEGTAGVSYRCLEPDTNITLSIENFFKLFSMSRGEKANFMTPKMETFFRALSRSMSEAGIQRFGSIEISDKPVAMLMVFDYNGTVYLYNSAYDPEYNFLSVGLLSKLFCLKESIEKGRVKWDFLQGGEAYKYQIGGKEVPLQSCRIEIN